MVRHRLPRGCSSAGRAPRSQRGSRRFESAHLHRYFPWSQAIFVTCWILLLSAHRAFIARAGHEPAAKTIRCSLVSLRHSLSVKSQASVANRSGPCEPALSSCLSDPPRAPSPSRAEGRESPDSEDLPPHERATKRDCASLRNGGVLLRARRTRARRYRPRSSPSGGGGPPTVPAMALATQWFGERQPTSVHRIPGAPGNLG